MCARDDLCVPVSSEEAKGTAQCKVKNTLNTWTVEQLVLVVEKCGHAENARKVDFPTLLAGCRKISER